MAKQPITRQERIVSSGMWGTVEYATNARGELPAKEFLDGLDAEDLAKLYGLFQWMADSGQIRNKSKFKHERGRIYTFKKNTNDCRMMRVPCFQIGNRWLLTHGFIKPGQDKWRPEYFTTAERIMNEYLVVGEAEQESQPEVTAKKKPKNKRRRRR